jgi:predicted phosphoserine aminotransferase
MTVSAETFGRFFLPGPTEVRPEILQAMVGPMMGHRTPEMEALMDRIQPGLQHTFRTDRPVYIAPASGTGMMEMGIRNVARERVLSLVNGAFSERYARIAELCGRAVDRVKVDWGENHTAEMLDDALAGGDYDTVTICHSETSTGVLNPVAELTEVAHRHGAMVCVDTVSSMAGAPFETDGWEVDFVASSGQKALALPPGLGFAVAREPVLERAAENGARGLYFDVLAFEKNLGKRQTPNTPAISLMYATAVQMAAILEEGIESRWARHRAMAERTYAWVDERRDDGLELGILAPDGYRSPTVTCVTVPEGIRATAICGALKARGWVVAPGYGAMKDDMFRIGHMGDHTLEELDALLDTITAILDEIRAPHD